MILKKRFSVLVLALTFVFLFNSVVSAAQLSYVYYENETGDIVKANNVQANFAGGDMLDKLLADYTSARNAGRPIYFETDAGDVYDWSAALESLASWTDVQAGPTTDAPEVDAELQSDGTIEASDAVAPVVTGITDGAVVKVAVTPACAEEGVTVTLTKDGQAVAGYAIGTEIAAQGEYVLTVSDQADNKTVINFTIDTTAPTLSASAVVTNYQTLTVNFSEKVKGTATATINGTAVAAADVVLAADGMSLALNKTAGYAVGAYTIVVNGLTDIAGNAMATNAQATVTKAASFVADFVVTTTALQAAANHKVYFTVNDQYGQDISASLGNNALDDAFVFSGLMDQLPLTVNYTANSGNKFVTIVETLVEGKAINLTFKNTVNTVDYTKTATYTVVAAAAAKATTVSEITGAASYTAGDNNITLTAVLLDQYGNPYTMAGGEKLRWTTSNASIVMLDNLNEDAYDGTFADGKANENTFNIDLLAPGTATVNVFLPGATTAAKSLTITVTDGDVTTINTASAAISVVNNAVPTVANIAINDALAAKYVLFKNAHGTNIPVLASGVSTSVVVQGTTTNASDVVTVQKVADANGFLTGLKVSTDRTEQDAAVVAGNPSKVYTVTLTSGEITGTFAVTSTIDTAVTAISDITFAENELTNDAAVVKAISFKNQYNEFVEVLDGQAGAGSTNVTWTTTAGLTLDSCKDVAGTTAGATDAITHIKFTATSAGAKTAAISAGTALKSIAVTVAEAGALTSFELGASTATVIIDDVIDTGDKTATDLVMLDNDSETVVLIPITFKDQYGNIITVNANQFDLKVTGTAPATVPLVKLYGAIADTTTALDDNAATAVTHIGVKAESADTDDTSQVLTLQMRTNANDADIGTSKTLSVTVQAARALNTVTVAPTSAQALVNVASTFTMSGVDQYGVAVDLDHLKTKLQTLANVTLAGQAANTDVNKSDFTLTASAAGNYTATVYYDANDDNNLDAGEKSTTVNFVVDTLANAIDHISIVPTVTVAGATTGAANTTYDAANYKVALDDDDADQTITFTVKAYNASNNEVAINQTNDVVYSVVSDTTDAVLSFTNNALTVNGSGGKVEAGDTITVKATSLNGKEATMTVTLDDIENAAAQAGTYYLASTTGTALTSLAISETTGENVLLLEALNQFGKVVDITENAASVIVAVDNTSVAAKFVDGDSIDLRAVAAGSTNVRVFVSGTAVVVLPVTVTQAAVEEYTPAVVAANSTAANTDTLDVATTESYTVTATAKDKYGLAVAGYTFKIVVTVTDDDVTTNESYTIDGVDYDDTAAAAALTTTTDENGVVTFEIVVPALVDENDGVSVQVTLNDGTTGVGAAIGDTK